MTVDLDALEKRLLKAKGGTPYRSLSHRHRTFQVIESDIEAAIALIAELKEARAENDRLQTAGSLAEDDKLVMAHELKMARRLLKETAAWAPTTGPLGDRVTAFLSKAQGGE